MSDVSSLWSHFISSRQSGSPKSDVWSLTLSQLSLTRVSQGIAYFQCSNNGVKTIALNKQIELAEIVTQVVGQHVVGVYCEVVQKKEVAPSKHISSVDVKGDAHLFTHTPSLDDLLISAGLSPRFSFDNFAVSSSNEVAHAAAQVVVKHPGRAYNPLFLWGGVGVGKTHLAQAIVRRLLQLNPTIRALFCPGDRFTNEIIDAIRTRSTERFRQRYRRLDVLVVDDVQFIAGKETVQQEFFHTFNDVVGRFGQVVLVSDRPPHDIPDVEDRLRSRFSGGLTVDISPPDLELRIAIVLIKARERNIDMEPAAAEIIARNAYENRMLEGHILSSYARALTRLPPNQNDKVTLTVADVEEFFRTSAGVQTINTIQTPIDPERVIQVVCSFYQIRPLHIRQQNRLEHISRARHVCMYILREKLGLGLTTIAQILKRKDHTTIIHGVGKIRADILNNPILKNEIDTLCQNLKLSP